MSKTAGYVVGRYRMELANRLSTAFLLVAKSFDLAASGRNSGQQMKARLGRQFADLDKPEIFCRYFRERKCRDDFENQRT